MQRTKCAPAHEFSAISALVVLQSAGPQCAATLVPLSCASEYMRTARDLGMEQTIASARRHLGAERAASHRKSSSPSMPGMKTEARSTIRRVLGSQSRVVNRELVLLNRQIGRDILGRQLRRFDESGKQQKTEAFVGALNGWSSDRRRWMQCHCRQRRPPHW